MSPLKQLSIPFKGHRAAAGPWGTPAMSTSGIYFYKERGDVIMILPQGIPARHSGDSDPSENASYGIFIQPQKYIDNKIIYKMLLL